MHNRIRIIEFEIKTCIIKYNITKNTTNKITNAHTNIKASSNAKRVDTNITPTANTIIMTKKREDANVAKNVSKST